MKGRVKNYNVQRKFGFIAPDDGSHDIFFHFDSVVDLDMHLTEGEPVEFEAEEQPDRPGRFRANNVRHPADYVRKEFRVEHSSDNYIRPGQYIYRWGFIILDDIEGKDGTRRQGALHDLKAKALKESWSFSKEENPRVPFPILKSYLTYTFFRLYKERKIKEVNHQGEQWAAFNTGLVNELYDPIYALFERNKQPSPPWRFNSFCCANIEWSGRKLASLFDPTPEPPQYFKNPRDLIYDPDATLLPRYDHIIYDGVARNRFPKRFLQDNTPKDIDWRDPDDLELASQKDYLTRFVDCIKADARCNRDIKRRIDDAIELAIKRARWNFKTAIPNYFPTKNNMSLLLPLALVDDEKVDIALVAERTPAGGYSGETVLKLSWAYEHARLVCRPDSDWLSPELIFGDAGEDELDEQ
jgi:cold shock CspA family protein